MKNNKKARVIPNEAIIKTLYIKSELEENYLSNYQGHFSQN